MYSYIKGEVTNILANYIVLENNGIGYKIFTSNPYSFKVGEKLCVYTYTFVREENFDLYGFKSESERELFIKLISVKGIGPKGAMAVLAKGDIEGLYQAIEDGDSKYLQKFPGIGPKASGQIILDLKGKLGDAKVVDPKVDNVKEALKSLGYSNSELKKLDKFLFDNRDLSIEVLIKESLKRLF